MVAITAGPWTPAQAQRIYEGLASEIRAQVDLRAALIEFEAHHGTAETVLHLMGWISRWL